ncbi:MAG TPA: carboxypeptidase-like regulatory domain-containing protein, partial [Planctomycetota bacterium]
CRAVLDGVPVPGTTWQAELVAESWSSNPFGACDDEGRFVLPIDDEEARVTWLELYHPEAGRRMLRAHADRLEGELGDVELVPNDALPFVVRTEDGAPVAGATASTIEPERFRNFAVLLALRGGGSPHCTPSGPDGRGLLHWPLTEAIEVRFDAPGLAPSTLRVGPESVLPIEVVLARGCTLAVRVRAPDGSPPPPGLEVTLSATEAPFLGPDGQPQAESAPCGWGGDGDGAYVRCTLDETGRLRFSGLKAGLPLTLALTDAQGFELAPPRELLLTPDEEQTLELTAVGRPRRLLVRVRDAFGRPLPRAWVQVRAAGAELHQSAVTLTDRAGQALFEAVFAPSVDLDVSHVGFERSVRSDCTLPAEDATLEVALAHDWWPW